MGTWAESARHAKASNGPLGGEPTIRYCVPDDTLAPKNEPALAGGERVAVRVF